MCFQTGTGGIYCQNGVISITENRLQWMFVSIPFRVYVPSAHVGQKNGKTCSQAGRPKRGIVMSFDNSFDAFSKQSRKARLGLSNYETTVLRRN